MLCLRTNERTLGKLKKIPEKGVRSFVLRHNIRLYLGDPLLMAHEKVVPLPFARR